MKKQPRQLTAKIKKNGEQALKSGPPEKTIDIEKLKALCSFQCTGEECASFFDLDYDTLNSFLKKQIKMGFKDFYSLHHKKGLVSLRRRQYTQAMEGDTKLLMHLGKHLLGQVDQFIVDNRSSDGTMTPTKIIREIVESKNPQSSNIKSSPNKQDKK